jgi:oligopeptide transport system substrate-binding protein
MRNPKRALPLLLTLLLAVLVGLACGSDKKETTIATVAPGSSGPAAQAGRPADAAGDSDQVLRASIQEPQYLDPHRSTYAADISIERMLFRGMFQLDKDAKPVPALAVELPSQQNGGISADGMTYTIKLKPGLKWSDGTPLTMKDFEYSLLRPLDPAVAGDYAFLLENVAGAADYMEAKAGAPNLEQLRAAVGVKALDDSTLQIKLAHTEPTFLTKISLWASFPVKREAVERDKEKAFTDGGKLVGTGPYLLKEWKPKESITLVPNPNWALEPKPVLKEIRLRIIDDDERAYDAYRNNELDALWQVPYAKLDQIKADATLKTQYVQQKLPSTRGIFLNQRVEALKNQKVRSALAKAMDRDAIVKTVYQGAHVPTTQCIPAGIGGIPQTTYDEQKFDPAAAKQLLADAGFPNGQGFPRLKLMLQDDKSQRDLGEFLKTDLKKYLNIDIDLDIVDSQTRKQRDAAGQFDMYFSGWIQDFPDPENWIDGLWNTDGALAKRRAFSNAELDQLFKANKYEPNQEKRLAAYRQMHDIVVKSVGIADLFHESNNYMLKPKVGGTQPTNNDALLPGDWAAETWYIKKS